LSSVDLQFGDSCRVSGVSIEECQESHFGTRERGCLGSGAHWLVRPTQRCGSGAALIDRDPDADHGQLIANALDALPDFRLG
jgi:hypothetical protein